LAEEFRTDERTREESEKRKEREDVLRVLLSSEARQRLANVRLVKPEVANLIENHIIQLASSGKLRKQLSDDELKQILASVSKPQKKEFKIRWI
jgi:programmed cell death protein 5